MAGFAATAVVPVLAVGAARRPPQHITPESAWQEFLVQQCGRTPIDGIVTSIVPFGAFVKLHDGVEGLLHRSEWSTEPQSGAAVSVRILQLDLVNRRVSLATA